MKFTALLFALFIYAASLQAQQVQAIQYFLGVSRYDIVVDAGDTIWTGSRDSGLVKIYNNTTQYFKPANSGIASKYCYVVSIDSSGNIWAGSDSGISVFDKTSWTIYNTSNSQLPGNRISALYHTNSGCWIGTYNGLAYFDGSSWTIYNTANSSLINDTVTAICAVGNTVYVGTYDGISVLNNSTWTSYPSGQNGLTSLPIREILFAGGRLWASTNTEVSYLEQGTFKPFQNYLFNDYPFIGVYNFQGLCADNTGNVYFIFPQNCIFKIKPDLTCTIYKLKAIGPSPYQPSAFVKGGTIYFVPTFLNLGCFKADLQNNWESPLAYLAGMKNDFLDVNNSLVRLLNRGDMHWDPIGQTSQYITPAGSYKIPVYCSALWLGGIDQGGQLHTAAMTYRQMQAWDFWAGPLDTITGQADSVSEKYYDRFWKIDYDMIQSFQINYQNGNLQNGTYTLPEAIASWPAHGTGNHSRNLAPFIDFNSDGVYNPYDGDYPELTGHQMLWWVFNDTANIHTETNGAAFGFEIQGKAYGYNCNLNPGADEVMNNTTFYQYKITNRSQNTYNSTWAGIWSDIDLGNAADDFIGCDSLLNTFFGYNGDNDDDGGAGYGLNPPMINVALLKGPLAILNDGLDNNHNGTVDEINEFNGLTNFKYYANANSTPNGNPDAPQDYYNYLQTKDTNGQPYIDGNGIQTTFMFAGTPYSTGPSMPNEGFQPDDVRALGASGPFALAPGESQTIDFAYIFTRDSLNPNGLTTSIAKNTADVQKIINGFNSGNYPCLTSVGIPPVKTPEVFTIYPNPANSSIRFNSEMLGARYEIYSLTGQLVQSGKYSGNPISVEALQPQVYIIKAQRSGQPFVQRMVKL